MVDARNAGYYTFKPLMDKNDPDSKHVPLMIPTSPSKYVFTADIVCRVDEDSIPSSVQPNEQPISAPVGDAKPK